MSDEVDVDELLRGLERRQRRRKAWRPYIVLLVAFSLAYVLGLLIGYR